MKKLIMGATAMLAVSSVAQAQEQSSAPLTNAYVGVSTSLEGTADWTLGTELNLIGTSTYAEFKYKDRVDGAGDAADDYAITLGSGTDIGPFALKSGISYEWGASGGDLIGRGEDNTWGDVTSSTTAKMSPGVIGGEYIYVGGSMDIASEGEIAINWGGLNYGVGYSHALNDRASVNIGYGWEVNVIDDDDDATTNNWVTETTGLKLGVGFKF